MKIDKLNIDGNKNSIEVLDKVFAAKINKQLVSNVLYKTNANYKGRKAKRNLLITGQKPLNSSSVGSVTTIKTTQKNMEPTMIVRTHIPIPNPTPFPCFAIWSGWTSFCMFFIGLISKSLCSCLNTTNPRTKHAAAPVPNKVVIAASTCSMSFNESQI